MVTTERIKGTIARERDDHERLIAELEDGLRIDKHGLDDALEQQPDLYYRVSKAVTICVSRQDALKQEVEEVEAEADERVRMSAETLKEKLTETECKMRARLDPKLKGVRQDYIRMNRKVRELQALEKAFSQRSYAIKELVSLYVASYWGDNTGGRSSNSMKDRDAAIARHGMKMERRERDRGRD